MDGVGVYAYFGVYHSSDVRRLEAGVVHIIAAIYIIRFVWLDSGVCCSRRCHGIEVDCTDIPSRLLIPFLVHTLNIRLEPFSFW